MKWKQTVKLKHLLTEEETPEAVGAAMNAVAAALTEAFHPDSELQELIDEMSCCNDLDDANNLLDSLYDWADNNRVWIT